MIRSKTFLLVTGLLLTGCLGPPAGPLITPVPTGYLPTSIALTVQARITPDPNSPTPKPAATAAGSPTPKPAGSLPPTPSATSFLGETVPTATPTKTPLVSPTPTPTAAPEIPAADIEITAPGALSKVVSPIPVRALLVPGDQGRVTVELLGEDGRVLTRQIVILNPDLGRKAGLVLDLTFEIPSEAELGRLVIYRQDDVGRTTALSSIELILLASGQPDYNAVIDRKAAIVIQEPMNGAVIQGGRVVVSGLARPSTAFDMVAELITATGQVVGQRVFNPGLPGLPQHVPFVVEVPFTADEVEWALLIIRERGERIPGITYLTSTEVLLSP